MIWIWSDKIGFLEAAKHTYGPTHITNTSNGCIFLHERCNILLQKSVPLLWFGEKSGWIVNWAHRFGSVRFGFYAMILATGGRSWVADNGLIGDKIRPQRSSIHQTTRQGARNKAIELFDVGLIRKRCSAAVLQSGREIRYGDHARQIRNRTVSVLYGES